jgi:hypothetical protein
MKAMVNGNIETMIINVCGKQISETLYCACVECQTVDVYNGCDFYLPYYNIAIQESEEGKGRRSVKLITSPRQKMLQFYLVACFLAG